MAMEARPQTALILVPAQLLFGLFMELLNGMTAMGIVNQLLQRRRGWQITPIEVAFLGLTTGRPLPQQPANVGLTFGRDAPGAHGDKLLAQPALGAVAPADGAPLVLGHRRQHLVGRLAERCTA